MSDLPGDHNESCYAQLEYFSSNTTSVTCGPPIKIGLPENLLAIAKSEWIAPFYLVTSGSSFAGMIQLVEIRTAVRESTTSELFLWP